MRESGIWILTPFHTVAKEKYRILKSLIDIGLIFQPQLGGSYRLSVDALNILTDYGFAEDIFNIIEEFLFDYNKKISWKREELETYFMERKILKIDFSFALFYGWQLGFFKNLYSLGSSIPTQLEITVHGENYVSFPEEFLEDIEIDERDFHIKFEDKMILDWLEFSAHGAENFELEFKLSLPPNPELKFSASTLANYSSGIIAVGFSDKGNLIDLEEPEKIQRDAITAFKDLESLNEFYRILKGKDGKRGLIIMVPKAKNVIKIGNTVRVRKGSTGKNLSKNETIQLEKKLKETQGGHLWIKSLRHFKYSRENSK